MTNMIKHQILRLVAASDGQLYWYHIDRSLSGSTPGVIGPFKNEILELEAEGLISIRPTDDAGGVRYWITANGTAALSKTPC